MQREINFSYNVINITVHPHTTDTYRDMFRDACHASVKVPQKYFGDELMDLRIRNLDPMDAGYPDFAGIAGDINRFMPIGDSPWYDREKGIPLSDEEKPNFDSNRFYPKLVSFPFVFLPDGHRLFIVSSLSGKRLTAAKFAKAFQLMFKRPELSEKYGDVSAHVETDKSGIDAILRIEQLEKLKISVTLPNGDDLAEYERIWVDRLKEQNISKIDENLTAQRGEKLLPDESTRALMGLAQSNGYISAEGHTNSEKVALKSSEFPLQYRDHFPEGASIFKKLIADAMEKISIFTNRNAP